MADLTEEEAVLHLKRALGELDSGDAVPRPLAPVSLPPPRAKVPKMTVPTQPARAAPVVGPSLGPSPVQPVSTAPSKQPTWAEIRLQQEHEQKQAQQARELQKQSEKSQKARDREERYSNSWRDDNSWRDGGSGGSAPPGPDPNAGYGGMGAMQNLKSQSGGASSGLPPMPAMPPGLQGAGGLPGLPAGFPGMPGMPPLPGAGGPPLPAGGAPAKPDNSVAAQVAAAMGPGKTQAHVDIPQAKAGMVIGRNSATLNAVKTYSKAECFLEEHTPDEDKARITIVGSPTQVEKCKQTVNALVDGTMSAATLFQLAGVPLPAGGAGEASASDRGKGGGNSGSAPMATQGGIPLNPALPPSALMPGAMPPMPFPGGMPGLPGMPPMPGMPGMQPEDRQMSQNMNDYYARWWATYQNPDQNKNKMNSFVPDGPAFDKDALAKLAAKASEPEPEMPPLPPEPEPVESAFNPSHRGVPISSLPLMSDPGMMAAPPVPDDSSYRSMPPPSDPGFSDQVRSSASSAPPLPSDVFDPEAGVTGSGPAVSSTAGTERRPPMKGFGIPMKTTEPPKAQKDNDSVQKMMERLQGNVQQDKQARKDGEDAPAPVQVRMQMRSTRGGPQASLAQMLEGGGAALPFGNENFRTRADVEFEALLGRMPAAQSTEDVETLGREILIRFNSFSPQQITELLQKIDSSAGLQNGDFQAELSRVLIPRLKEFNSAQFTTLTSTFASWSNDARGNKKKGRFSEFSKAFFLAASAEMTSRLMEYAPHEINCCLAAFVSVGFSEHKFFASVGRAALARHSSFAPVQLTALLAILSEMRLVHVDLFNASAQFLSTRAKELRPVDVIRVLRSFSKCGVHNHGMCRAIGDEVVLRVRMKSSTFKVEDLCEISWAFCVLSYYHEDMFRTTFKELEKSPMISTDALIQVYECHLTLDCEHRSEYSRYRMDNDLAHALQDHYREHRKDERRCSERQRNDVASVLKSLVDGSVHVNHRTSTGLLVDVAALRKRSSTDGFIHVDLDSAVTVVRSLDQEEASPSSIIIEGPVALRRRILAKHGLRLVTVRESEWRDLDDSKDKRRHLRSLLSSLGDVLE